MRILITGITSALGSAIADSLEGHEVIGLARREHEGYPTICCDLRAALPRLPEVDVCLHLAFANDPRYCKEHSGEAHRINVLATKQLLKIASRFVFISSGSVCGFQDGLSSETVVPAPADDYARMKLEAENVVASHQRRAVLRWFYPYGPGTKPESLVNRLIRRVEADEEIPLHNDGRPCINPIFITDLVAATRVFCVGHLEGVYNVAGREVVSIEELARLIGEAVGRRPIFRMTGQPIQDMAGSTAKLSEFYRPKVSLQDGLSRTVHSLLGEMRR